MARITSPSNLAGTYGNLVVYQVGSKLYARTKSSLTGQRFRKEPAFIRSREKAKQFGEASQLAKTLYATLPKALKKKGLFGKLTGLVHKGLQEGKTKETITRELQCQFGNVAQTRFPDVAKPASDKQHPLSNWLVTKEGWLQLCTPSFLPYNQPSQEDSLFYIPDGIPIRSLNRFPLALTYISEKFTTHKIPIAQIRTSLAFHFVIA